MFITNFSKKDLPIYEKAIETYVNKTGRDTLYIVKTGYDHHGELLPNDRSLHNFKLNDDLTDFWDIFYEVKKEYHKAPENDPGLKEHIETPITTINPDGDTLTLHNYINQIDGKLVVNKSEATLLMVELMKFINLKY